MQFLIFIIILSSSLPGAALRLQAFHDPPRRSSSCSTSATVVDVPVLVGDRRRATLHLTIATTDAELQRGYMFRTMPLTALRTEARTSERTTTKNIFAERRRGTDEGGDTTSDSTADTTEDTGEHTPEWSDQPVAEGMVFAYYSPRRGVFWMRNTVIPLDATFWDSSGKLLGSPQTMKPLDETYHWAESEA